jgi:hypothetical protein
MLNVTEIAERIKNPSLCKEEDLNDLLHLADKYPYSSIFSILYLYTLGQYQHVHFEEELQRHAFRISNREHLYEMIHTALVENPGLVEAKAEAPLEVIHLSVAEKEEIQPLIVAEEKLELKPLETFEKEAIFASFIEESQETEVEENTAVIETETPIETEKTVEEIVIADEKLVLTPLEHDIHETAVEHEMAFESVAKEENLTPIEVSTELPESMELDIISNAILATYELQPELEIPTLDLTHSKTEEVVVEPKSEEIFTIVEKNISNLKEQKLSFSGWLKVGQNVSSDTPIEPKRQDEILDQFIQEQPKITRLSKETEEIPKPKSEFYSPTKKAKESVDEEAIPVSETLAKIFAIQGNFSKAISAYEQLCLIYPEKKTFFANQIEELKSKINN